MFPQFVLLNVFFFSKFLYFRTIKHRCLVKILERTTIYLILIRTDLILHLAEKHLEIICDKDVLLS